MTKLLTLGVGFGALAAAIFILYTMILVYRNPKRAAWLNWEITTIGTALSLTGLIVSAFAFAVSIYAKSATDAVTGIAIYGALFIFLALGLWRLMGMSRKIAALQAGQALAPVKPPLTPGAAGA